jgi:uncharacterized protein (TIGR02996 family)
MDDESFLETIRRNPEEDAPRLVYADWLEERGDPRAEFLRLDCRLGHLSSGSRTRPKIRTRMDKLRQNIDGDWMAWVERADRFSLCWNGPLYESEGMPLRYVAYNWRDNNYDEPGIQEGDYVYLFQLERPRALIVIARMRVIDVTTPDAFRTASPDALAYVVGRLGEDIGSNFMGDGILIGDTGSTVRLCRPLPTGVVHRLKFQDRKRKDPGVAQYSDFAGFARLTMATAMDFERSLAGMPFPDLPAEEGGLFR